MCLIEACSNGKYAAVGLCIQIMIREYETKTICLSGHVLIIKKIMPNESSA